MEEERRVDVIRRITDLSWKVFPSMDADSIPYMTMPRRWSSRDEATRSSSKVLLLALKLDPMDASLLDSALDRLFMIMR